MFLEALISPSPLISVVIPHLNEPGDLRRCLNALDAQRGAGVPFEVIVVDNGSRQPPADVCAAFEGVRLVIEPTPGPGPARSRGAAAAQGDIVAFIDADCLAQPGWLSGIASHFATNPETDVIAGSVGIARVAPDRPTALELYESIYSYRVRLYVERDHYAATGNMAVRKSVFEKVGPFGGITTMEDRAWGQRATELGFRLAYVPDIRVLTPACKGFGELTRRWDRHVAHDFKEVAPGLRGALKWTALSLAVAVSPALEAVRLALRRGEPGLWERARAFGVLVRIRLYRAGKMMALLADNRSTQMVNSWNRS